MGGDITQDIEVYTPTEEIPLKPTSGFFFGSTEFTEYFIQSLQHTVDEIAKLDPNTNYVYQSSW